MKKNTIALIGGLLSIIIFIFGIAPLILSSGNPKEMKHFIEENEIEANALFYTESPKVGEVEFFLWKEKITSKQ